MHGVRAIPRDIAPIAAPLVAAPRASGQALSSDATGLTANFNGTSSRDSAVTNFGAEFEPPDQGLCAGNGFVVEHGQLRLHGLPPNGTVVTGPFNVNGPFDEGLTEFTSDPRCQYDAATNTWFATILFISADNTHVTRSTSPSTPRATRPTPWTMYQIDTTDTGGKTGPKHPGCPCFGDQPLLGHRLARTSTSPPTSSRSSARSSTAPRSTRSPRATWSTAGPPSTPAHFVHFDNLNIGGTVAASVQPAITTGNAPAEYFLNSLDPNGTFDQRVGVWAMTNRGAVATGGKPTLSSIVIAIRGIRHPARRRAEGRRAACSTPATTACSRPSSSAATSGASSAPSVTIPNDPAARAGAAWFDVRPTVSNGVISTAPVRRQGYVSLAGNYLIYPALQATPSGKAAMVITLSGPRQFPSAAYSVLAKRSHVVRHRSPSPPRAGPTTTRTRRAGATTPGRCSTRPGTSVWMATEYIPPKASQTTDGARNWGTRVLNLRQADERSPGRGGLTDPAVEPDRHGREPMRVDRHRPRLRTRKRLSAARHQQIATRPEADAEPAIGTRIARARPRFRPARA